MAKTTIAIKRVYEEPGDGDGLRILVDRVWPRGVSKDAANLDAWLKDLGPSDALRKWFGHDPPKFAEFKQRYEKELAGKRSVIDQYLSQWSGRHVTLLYGAKDREHNQAVVLRDFIQALL